MLLNYRIWRKRRKLAKMASLTELQSLTERLINERETLKQRRDAFKRNPFTTSSDQGTAKRAKRA